MDSKHKGALAELKAASWLLKEGYEVFRNVSQHGAVDLVALDLNTQEILLIDVKTSPIGTLKQTLARKTVPGVRLMVYTPDDDSCVLAS